MGSDFGVIGPRYLAVLQPRTPIWGGCRIEAAKQNVARDRCWPTASAEQATWPAAGLSVAYPIPVGRDRQLLARYQRSVGAFGRTARLVAECASVFALEEEEPFGVVLISAQA